MTRATNEDLCLSQPACFDGLRSDAPAEWDRMVIACLEVRAATTRRHRTRTLSRAAAVSLQSVRTLGGLDEWDASLLLARLGHIAGQQLPLSAEHVAAERRHTSRPLRASPLHP